MKDMFRNPSFYFVAVPLCVAFWPLSVWTKYLPDAERDVETWSQRKVEAEDLMVKILQRDPSRIEQSEGGANPVVFDYAVAVDEVTRLYGIRTRDYEVASQPRIPGTAGKPQTQSATVTMNAISIEQTANFLWKIQLKWPGLSCERIKFTHKKGEKDVWDVDLKFKYEF